MGDVVRAQKGQGAALISGEAAEGAVRLGHCPLSTEGHPCEFSGGTGLDPRRHSCGALHLQSRLGHRPLRPLPIRPAGP